MKKIQLITPLCLGILSATLSSYAWSVHAPITAVTLYSGSAMIERVVTVPVGAKSIKIEGLPANYDPLTLRIQSGNAIKVGQIVTETVDRNNAKNPKEASLELKLEQLSDQINLLNVDSSVAELQKQYLTQLGTSGKTEKSESLGTMMQSLKASAKDALLTIEQVTVKRRTLEKEQELLQRELERMQSNARDERQLTVNVSAPQGGELQLSYQVQGAGWQPAYRAGLNVADSKVFLERLANVSQKTGEDWVGITLKLSTGQPQVSPVAPDPAPWLVNYNPPQPPQVQYAVAPYPVMAMAMAPKPRMRNQSKMLESADSAVAVAEEAYIPPVLVVQQNFSTEYVVPSRVDLPSDGREISVNLSAMTVPVQQQIQVVPKMAKYGVLTATAERPEGVWLDGDVQLYRDGSYVGSSYWSANTQSQLFLPFGRDPLLNVVVDRVKDSKQTTGMLTKSIERDLIETYKITSKHSTPVDLLVLESTPISENEALKVTSTFTIPPTVQTWQGKQGVNAWQKKLAPHETFVLGTHYQFNYPEKGYVIGLP